MPPYSPETTQHPPFKLTRFILRPSDGQEVEFDGHLPEELDFVAKKSIDFTDDDIAAAFHEGKMDGETRTFLKNVLAEASTGDASRIAVIGDCREYMDKLLRGLKPGKDRFMRMQKLGFFHHVGQQTNRLPIELNLSGYDLPEIKLSYALCNLLRMDYTTVHGAVDLICAKMKGVSQERAVVHGDMDERGIIVGGNMDKSGIRVDGNIEQGHASIYGNLNLISARARGCLRQPDIWVGNKMYLLGSDFAGGVERDEHSEIVRGITDALPEF